MGFDDEDLFETWIEEGEEIHNYRYRGDPFNPENLKAVLDCGEAKIICSGAFYGCSNLEWIEIPDTLVEIQADAFCFCDSLTYMQLNNVRIIGDNAFSYCDSLKEVDFGYNAQLEKLGDAVFKKCIGLNDITLPASLKQIGGFVFEGCGEKKRHFQLKYEGSKSSFRKIKLDKNWNSGSTIEKICCVDGDLYVRKPRKEYL